jgi:hypothetical protein
MYKAIKAYGHNVYIVASTKDNSRTGGTVSLTMSANLTADTEFGERLFDFLWEIIPIIIICPFSSNFWSSSCIGTFYRYSILPQLLLVKLSHLTKSLNLLSKPEIFLVLIPTNSKT